MMIVVDANDKNLSKADVLIIGVTQKKDKADLASLKNKELSTTFESIKNAQTFQAAKGSIFGLTFNQQTCYLVGLGEKTKCQQEDIRRIVATIYQKVAGTPNESVFFNVQSFNTIKSEVDTVKTIAEAIELSQYRFDKYLAQKNPSKIKNIYLGGLTTKANLSKHLESVNHFTSSINFTRDLVNEVPNYLTSVQYAKVIEDDVKKNLKRVKVKILNKAEIKKEKMNLLLSVNNGSAHEPRLVHLTYEPAKKNSKTKHVALVGKGITFDTGGYSLKPGGAMMGMKFDMAGSATLYGAFRAAVLEKANVKITCILAMTDNAVSATATMPDSVIKGRSGKTVEILNTDAEGRLILADALDYACDLKPDYLIDAATLTGACLVALGDQVCGVMGNNQKWVDTLLKKAKEQDEYMWQLPIIDEWRNDLKSKVADIKNIGTAARAGTAVAAAFLENFIKNDVAWAHLDIAGVAGAQRHLSYCATSEASGLMVRTVAKTLLEMK